MEIKEDRRKYNTSIGKTIRILMVILILPLINMITVTYMAHEDISNIEVAYKNRHRDIQEARWMYMMAVLEENNDKASLQACNVRDNIERSLLSVYANNLDQLKIDLDSSNDNTAFKIMGDEIRGKYLNVNNDNNDMFIANSKGILVDNSLNCSIGKSSRYWTDEAPLQANPILASVTMKLLVQQSTYSKFWQFEVHENPNHIQISYPSIENLKQVYMAEGVKGLNKYEFLNVAYIRKDKDIFDTPDVNYKGTKTDNYKLIVVQGFNLVDVLEKKHSADLAYFSNLEKFINDNATAKKTQKSTELFLTLALLLSSFIGIALTTKIIINWGGEGANHRR